MSEQISEIKTPQGAITLMAFWGGEKRGKCLHIGREGTGFELSIPDLILLLPALKQWLSEEIKPKS